MSPDDIDSLGVVLVKWFEENRSADFDDDKIYDEFSDILYHHLDRFCKRDRSYN